MKSCIYKISNKINSRIYIGSAIDFVNRKSKHLRQLNSNKHCNIKLQRFYNKYGNESLVFSIVEYCEKENLLEREQFYINNLNCVTNGFNILSTAGSWLNHSHTEKSKKKLSATKKGIQTKGMLGKVHSEKTKELIAKKALGRKQSEDTIKKRISKNTGKKRPLSAIYITRKKREILNREQVLKIRELLNQKINQYEIAKQFGVCQGVISRINIGKAYYDVV